MPLWIQIVWKSEKSLILTYIFALKSIFILFVLIIICQIVCNWIFAPTILTLIFASKIQISWIEKKRNFLCKKWYFVRDFQTLCWYPLSLPSFPFPLCNLCYVTNAILFVVCVCERKSGAFFNWRIFLQCTTFFQKLGICAVFAFFAWTLNYDRIASILVKVLRERQ